MCAFQVLSCNQVIKEVLFFGTAGFSARLGGILNPPRRPASCEMPKEQGILTRAGDLCVTRHAVNWDCQSGSWSQTSTNWPNICTMPGDPNQPFNNDLQAVGGDHGYACFPTPPPESSSLLEEILASSDALQSIVPSEPIQMYTQYYWGNMTAGTNVTWSPNVTASPIVYKPGQCAEIDSVWWWTGVPWDAQARAMVDYALTGNDTNLLPTVAASAMEGIGFLAALSLANNITGKDIPYAIIRACSDYVHVPITRAANGTWLEGSSVSIPSGSTFGLTTGAPGTVYAIQSGNTLILDMFQKRCLALGKNEVECSISPMNGTDVSVASAQSGASRSVQCSKKWILDLFLALIWVALSI